MTAPTLSIVVIFHDMTREAPRTLRSLARPYQQNVDAADYEIIAIDNGSSVPLTRDALPDGAENIQLVRHDTSSVSPVEAINLGLELARGDAVAVIVDGARMATPGLVHWTLKALSICDQPLLGCLSWHLGPDVQNVSITNGYDAAVEDSLLAQINWPEDGYRLLEISTLAQSSACGFLGGVPAELSWLCMRRETLLALGGYDPAFTSPGGGLVNHDTVLRALALPDIQPVMLLGEGVFHQIHGGVATNVPMTQHPIVLFQEEYKRLRGTRYRASEVTDVSYIGQFTPSARAFIVPR